MSRIQPSRRSDDDGTHDEEGQATTGYCPECGAEIWDQADVCPRCYAYIGGEVLHRPPMERWWRDRWKVVVLLVLLAAFLVVALR